MTSAKLARHAILAAKGERTWTVRAAAPAPKHAYSPCDRAGLQTASKRHMQGEILRESDAEGGCRVDEREQAQRALTEKFRRDRAKLKAHPTRAQRWRLNPVVLRWLLAVTVVIFVLSFPAFILIYPRFGPIDTMTSFCRAEGDGDYATAYGLLSQPVQQRVSLATFTQVSRNTILVSCSANHGIPIIFGGARARLDAHYDLSDSNGFDGAMTFVREHDEWRVDSMTPDLFDLS